MKNPALPGGVSSQFKLRLTRLLLALVLDIVPNRGLVDAHCGGEKWGVPKLRHHPDTLCVPCAGISLSAADWSHFSRFPPPLKPRIAVESPCANGQGPDPPQFPPETNRGEIPARSGGPSSGIQLLRARGFFAGTASPTPNGTESCTPHEPVDGVSSTAIIAPGEQQTAPCSHPHPPRWGTPAQLERS